MTTRTATVSTNGDFTEDPWRPGLEGRYQAIYKAKTEAAARAQMDEDERRINPAGVKYPTHVVSVHWYPGAKGFLGRTGDGTLVVIFDRCNCGVLHAARKEKAMNRSRENLDCTAEVQHTKGESHE